MTKKIILAVASGLILLVLYLLYSLQTEPVTVRPSEVASGPTSLPALPQAATQPTARMTPAGVPVGASERVFFEWFAEDGRKSGEWRAELANPTGPNEFELERPEALLYTGDGQIIRLQADKGQMVVDEAEGRLDPKRGRVWGNVLLTIDRATDAWRELHPELAGPDEHPHLLVQIRLDDMGFDRELAKIWADGPVSVSSHEVDFDGQGLVLTWDELLGRLDWLRVEEGHRVTYRGRRGLFGLTEAAASAPGPKPPELPDTGQGFAIRQPGELSPWCTPPPYVLGESVAPGQAAADREELQPDQPPPPTYRATFAGPVVIRSQGRDRGPSELTGQELSVVFDFTRRQEAEGPEGSADQLAGRPEEEFTSTLQIDWSGPLEVRPIPAPENRSDRDRLFVVLRGQPVELRDERGEAHAETLVYDEGGERLWLLGSRSMPVRLADQRSRRMTGQAVFVDQLLGRMRIDGSGRMQDLASPVSPPATDQEADAGEAASAVSVSWQRGAELYLAARPGEQAEPTSPADLLGGRYAYRTLFHGEVCFRQAEQGLRAQAVELRFGPPLAGEGTLARPTELTASVQVRLDFGPEEVLTCDRLGARFARDSSGEVYPQVAHAVGDVAARQQTRSLSAGRMQVALQRFQEADGTRRLALVAADAYENVLVNDPVKPIHIVAQEVRCTMPNGRELEKVLVAGAESQVAEVQIGQRAIRGQRVELDLVAGTGQVPGPGWLCFVSDRDLEGRRQDAARAIEVEWSERMGLSGGENILRFAGDVRAQSETNQLRCDRLGVEFVDEPAAESAAPPQREPWWVFERAVRGSGQDQQRRSLEPVTVALAKRPIYLLAEGQVVLVSEDIEAGGATAGRLVGRRRIDGPAVAVDLAEERFQVIGPGHLLVEDYRQAEQRRPRAVPLGESGWSGRLEPREPLLEDLTRRGPSQSLFTWGSSMSYTTGSGLAIFDQQVRMKHLWGSKMILADQLLARSPAERQEPGISAGGEASLICDHLLVGLHGGTTKQLRARRWGLSSGQLDRLVATGRVHMQEGSLSLEGTRLCYWGEINLVELEGSGELQASLYDSQPDGTYRTLRAPWMRWHRQSGRIEAAQAVIMQTGP